VEWLHVRFVRGSQKALVIKNGVVSLYDHTEPLEEELGLAIITRALWNSVTQFPAIADYYYLPLVSVIPRNYYIITITNMI